MRVTADRMRLVTADGQIYGDAGLESADLPLLRGAFDQHETHYTWSEDNTLLLDPLERSALQEALELLKTATSLGIKEIVFQKFRGFSLQLAQSETEVLLGRAPFEENLKHLQSILGDLAKKGSQASRIELDFQGKAFVKERKL